jgi:methylase of polypeptide subunit release factors
MLSDPTFVVGRTAIPHPRDMGRHRVGDVLALDDPQLIAELGETLRAAGYSGERVRQALGSEGALISRPSDRLVHMRKLAGQGPLGTLVRLFVLAVPVTAAEAAEAVAPVPLERLSNLGLIETHGDEVTALVRIVPHDDLLIASDQRLEPGQPTRPNYVAGVHAPSLTLSHLTVRRPVETALDMGCGCGIQAILASRHSERVVATDFNPRATEFARFNAWLNGATNVEVREGSYFEPVDGSRFDLVVTNPPYVISPESEYLYRDSGLPGDTVSRQVVAQAPSALNEGGFATILVSWVHASDEHWARPLREWIDGNGCDAWLLHYASVDPATHTANWNNELSEHDPDAFAETLERWLAYFKRLGIETIATGAVILRKRSAGPNWVREDDMPQDRLTYASDHIARVFAAQDRLSALTNEGELLEDRFALAARTRLEQSVLLQDRAWTVDSITLTLQEGLGFRVAIDANTAQLLAQLDGSRTLSEVAGPVATAALPVVRSLYASGFLVSL